MGDHLSEIYMLILTNCLAHSLAHSKHLLCVSCVSLLRLLYQNKVHSTFDDSFSPLLVRVL